MKNCARIKKNKMTWKGRRMYEINKKHTQTQKNILFD